MAEDRVAPDPPVTASPGGFLYLGPTAGVGCCTSEPLSTPQHARNVARMNPTPTETRSEVKRLLSQGYRPRSIAKCLEISTQRVYQHMDALKEEAQAKESAS